MRKSKSFKRQGEKDMKFCPLKFASGLGPGNCIGEACAWFDKDTQTCAMLLIAYALQAIYDK